MIRKDLEFQLVYAPLSLSPAFLSFLYSSNISAIFPQNTKMVALWLILDV